MATIEIPTPLRPYANDKAVVNVKGTTVSAVLDDLIQTYPVLEKHLKKLVRVFSFVIVRVVFLEERLLWKI